MRADVDPETLLAGPRGRRVCWELLTQTGGWEFEEPPESAGPAALAAALAPAVARSDVGALADAHEPASFVSALDVAVSWARYWQEPDDLDRRLADPLVAEQLWPAADAVSRAPAARWWLTPMDPASQYEVVFDDPEGRVWPDPPDDGRAALAAWHADALEHERRSADRPDDPRAMYSGFWWSTPALSGLRCSTRDVEPIGPIGLHLVEDASSWSSARCWSLRVRAGASVFEIGGEDDWAELAARYPLAVTKSRRHDWWRTTGRHVEWAIPDYSAVAADYDAVHLTVVGYLSTAGRAVPAGEAYTVLAGWDPDRTWWLTDSPRRIDPPIQWVATGDREPFAWARRGD